MAADAIIAAAVSIIGCLTGLVTALAYFYKPLTDKCEHLRERIRNHKKLKGKMEMVEKVVLNDVYSDLLKGKARMLVEDVKSLKIEEEINKTCLFGVPDICSRIRIGTLIVHMLKDVDDQLLNDEELKEKSKLTVMVPPPQAPPPQAAPNTTPKETDPQTMEPAEKQQREQEIKPIEDDAHPKDAQNAKPTADQQKPTLESKPIEDAPTLVGPEADNSFIPKVKEVWRKNKEKRGTGILAFVIGVFLIAGLFYLGIFGITASVISFIFLGAVSFCLPDPKEKLRTLTEKKEELSKLIGRLSNEPRASQWKDNARKLYEEVNEKELEEKINKNCQIECLPDIYSRLTIGRNIAQKIKQIKEALKEGESFITTSPEKSISSSLSSRQCQASTTLVSPKTNDAIEEMWRVEMMAPLGCSSWTVNFAGSTGTVKNVSFLLENQWSASN